MRALNVESWTDAASALTLAECYALCRDIARNHSKTFYMSSTFLTPEQRRAVWAVYAFCRTADDIVDRTAPASERLAQIDEWEAQLLAAYAGHAIDPIFTAYTDAAARFSIPLEPALALLQGARGDITIHRYATFGELREYCYLVASTVGLLVTPILGVTSDAALPYAIELGRAMQMTNILRDVGEDARMDRIYLPAEDLLRFGYTQEQLLASVVDDAFVALMRFQIARVRDMYAQAEPGIAMLAPQSRYTVRLALRLYSGILDAIEANGYDVFGRRAFVPTRQKVLLAMSTALGR